MSMSCMIFITCPKNDPNSICLSYTEYFGEVFGEFLSSLLLENYSPIFHKLIDIEGFEFFKNIRFYKLEPNEVRLIIKEIDNYYANNSDEKLTKDALLVKKVWSEDIRNSLIKNILNVSKTANRSDMDKAKDAVK